MRKQSNPPHWLSEYRQIIEKNRMIFDARSKRPFIAHHASLKFKPNGEPRKFYGWSLVYFFPHESELLEKLGLTQSKLYNLVQASGIASKFAFLPISTYHVTIVGIATNKSIAIQDEIIKRVRETFDELHEQGIQSPRIHIRGDISPDGSTLIAPVEPVDKASLDTLYNIRDLVRRKLHPLGEDVVRNTAYNFHGHITLAYIIRELSHTDYAKIKHIVQMYDLAKSLGEINVQRISLRRFETMVDWGEPITYLYLRSNRPSLDDLSNQTGGCQNFSKTCKE